MNRIAPMHSVVLLLFAGSGVFAAAGPALAQSPALPATPPTTARPAADVPAAAAVPAPAAAYRARVVFSGGQLEITADNSSLNQILRDVSRLTGMKITGGVADQRVFGKYGPGAPGGILASLLEGMGSNIMLRESASHTPVELVLTPREGRVTPPGPFASGSEDDALPMDERPAQPAAPSAPPPPAVPSNPQSPNAVLTPQQILQQLLKLQPQQQKPSSK
jgi:hypothetical protein